MNYDWVNAGDQDEEVRKLCPLGPYLLELIEDHWGDNDQLIMSFNAYKWNSEEKSYDKVETYIKPQDYNWRTSPSVLEDWYACNVLFEENLGKEDEKL